MKTAFGCLGLLIVICGCGGSVAEPPKISDPEEVAIKEMIMSINGATKEEWKDLFVGDPPKQKEFLEQYYISFPQLEPRVEVNGDTATVKVEVSQVVEEGGFTQDQIEEIDWTLKKVDGKWKVESGPVN